MDLKSYAAQSHYLNWSETDTYNIALAITFDEFINLEPVTSDKFDSEQFEIPIIIIDGKDTSQSILATKSKVLLNELIKIWNELDSVIVRIHKKGSGFYTKYHVTTSTSIYDKASGKIAKKTPKK